MVDDLLVARNPDAEILERHPVRTCTQRGPAIHLVLDRARENRSQLVLTRAKGREVIRGDDVATTPAGGDYAVDLYGEVVAAVERKTLGDLASSLLSGRLTYALAELAALPRAAVVVEDRYSRLFKLPHVSGSAVAESLAEAQARFPSVPVTFCETRPLAEEWTYRWLGACLAEISGAEATADVEETFARGKPLSSDAGVAPGGPAR